MNAAALDLGASPPLRLPLLFLLSVPLFGVLAALLLLAGGSALVVSRWQPLTLAWVHLLALGVLMTGMLGSLLQMLPVLLGARVRRVGLWAPLIHAALVGGTLLLVTGFALTQPSLLQVGALALAAALALFVAAAAPGFLRAPRSGETAQAMVLAALALLLTLGLGFALAGGHAGWWPLYRSLTDLHAGWAALGWVGLLVIAVAYQVVPMFSVCAPYPLWQRRALAPTLFGVLTVASLGAWWPLPYAVRLLLAALAASAVIAFAASTLWLQHTRRRKLPDVWLDYWKLALAAAALAAGGGLLGYLWPALWADPRYELLLGVLWLAVFAPTLMAGMLQRIVAFLIWLDLSARVRAVARGRQPPNLRELVPAARMRGHWRLHALACLLLCLAVLWPALTRIAGLLWAFAWIGLGLNLLAALRTWRRWRRELDAMPSPSAGTSRA